jgi:hypothetical protein
MLLQLQHLLMTASRTNSVASIPLIAHAFGSLLIPEGMSKDHASTGAAVNVIAPALTTPNGLEESSNKSLCETNNILSDDTILNSKSA